MLHFKPDYAIDSITYIQEILESRNITYKELALMTKIPEDIISDIMNRIIPISYGHSFLISEALNVEHDIFLNLDLNYMKFMKKNKKGN